MGLQMDGGAAVTAGQVDTASWTGTVFGGESETQRARRPQHVPFLLDTRPAFCIFKDAAAMRGNGRRTL